MRRALLAILVLLGSASPAAAWDPDASAEESEPEPEAPAPEATASEPAPAPPETPEGVYYVTETYVRDVVTNSGNTTTYSTETVNESTGSYARVLGSVGSGERSVLDGTAFNGRSAFADGTPVAGTYYENFVLTPDGFVSVSIVFFQDDSVTKRSGGAPTPPASPDVVQEPKHVPTDPLTVIPPDDRDKDKDVPSASRLTVGIALAPDGPVLRGADVLRGREAQFWPKAFVDGRATTIVSWRLLGPPPDYTLATSGESDPLIAEWRQMPSTPWTLMFEVVASADPKRTLTATITVVVRSPALVQ